MNRHLIVAVSAALTAILSGSAYACSCVNYAYPPGYFLHLDENRSIALPANARGILFNKNATLDVRAASETVTILNALPAAMAAEFFSMRDLNTNHAVRADFAPLDIDAQMGMPHTYYLAVPGQIPDGTSIGYYDDLHQAARKYRLIDVSTQVKATHGLFRVAPAGGLEGRPCVFAYAPPAAR